MYILSSSGKHIVGESSTWRLWFLFENIHAYGKPHLKILEISLALQFLVGTGEFRRLPSFLVLFF